MPEPAEDQIVRNLAKAIERLHEDLDRVELWTAALNCFQLRFPIINRASVIFCRPGRSAGTRAPDRN